MSNKQIYNPYASCICGSLKKAKFCCLINAGKKWFKEPHMIKIYPLTDKIMKRCYAASLGNCEGKPSLEHYISDCILKYLSDNYKTISIAGTKFANNKFKHLPFKSLASKVLCERHNNSLNKFDFETLNFIKAIDEIDINFVKGYNEDKNYVFSGHDLERWMLKTCFAFSKGILNKDYNIDKVYLSQIYNNDWFKNGTGMYINCNNKFHHFSSISFVAHTNKHERLQVAEFRLNNMLILLVLDSTVSLTEMYPNEDFLYQPNGICFKNESVKNYVDISWIDSPHNDGIFLNYMGKTNERPHNWQRYEKNLNCQFLATKVDC